MTKSELIAELASANPHLLSRDVELIVSTIFDEITGRPGPRHPRRAARLWRLHGEAARTPAPDVTRAPARRSRSTRKPCRSSRQVKSCESGWIAAASPCTRRPAPNACSRSVMRILLAAPVLLILVIFALSNRQVVQLGLWPTDIMVDAPLSITVLVAAGLFFIGGALMTWGQQRGHARPRAAGGAHGAAARGRGASVEVAAPDRRWLRYGIAAAGRIMAGLIVALDTANTDQAAAWARDAGAALRVAEAGARVFPGAGAGGRPFGNSPANFSGFEAA